MELIIFAFIAIILLIPILYLLPIGINQKGKFIIIGVSFLLAVVGLLVNSLFSLWQTALVLLFLSMASTYLLAKKLSFFFYKTSSANEMDEPALPFEIQEKERVQVEGANEEEMEEQLIEKQNVEDFIDPTDGIGNQETADNENVHESISSDDDTIDILPFGDRSEANDKHTEAEIVENQKELHTKDFQNSENLQVDEDGNDDIDFLENRVTRINEFDVELEDETVPSNERLTDKDLSNDVDEEDSLLFNELEGISDSLNKIEQNAVTNREQSLEKDLKESGSIEESKFLDNQDELFKTNEQTSNRDAKTVKGGNESIYNVSNEEYRDIHEKEYEPFPASEWLEENDESFSEIESLEKLQVEQNEEVEIHVVTPEQTKLRQQMFHTMVERIHLSRKKIPAKRYEQLIKEHLHPGLPNQDYYTFAHLLIEHYIYDHNDKELCSLLIQLKDKFVNYPILQQEIDYLQEQYCKK